VEECVVVVDCVAVVEDVGDEELKGVGELLERLTVLTKWVCLLVERSSVLLLNVIRVYCFLPGVYV
jgi:hypothetical protein